MDVKQHVYLLNFTGEESGGLLYSYFGLFPSVCWELGGGEGGGEKFVKG